MVSLLSGTVHLTTAGRPLIPVPILLLHKSQYASLTVRGLNMPNAMIHIWKAVFVQEMVTVSKPAVTVNRFDC